MRILICIILIINLWACTPKRPARVDEINTKPHRTQTKSNDRHPIRKHNQTTHQVSKGESLYSIGFKYQVDYKKLAAYNNIKAPYQIYPKQILRLTAPPQQKVFKPSKESVVQTKPLSNNKPVVAQSTTTPAASTKPKPKPTTTASANQKTPNKTTVVKTPTNNNLKWLWPTDGIIRTTFLASNPARKGISISGKEGQAIKAAEAGVVVYSGNGLLGYGELIIIKHNEQYLSAYGHNKSLKVKEGESVTRGQVIAELGSTGTNVNNLHFEIRKNGKPVNPLDYVKP